MIHIPFDCLDSTNRWVKEHALELDPDGFTCVTAKEQRAGYGTRGREWVSPKGNLYATFFFRIAPEEQPIAAIYTQLLALACVEVMEEEGVFLKIKWPNDLFYEGKKCGGILAECLQLPGKLGMALGIGLNVNTEVEGAISLKEIAGRTFELEVLLYAIAGRFEHWRERGYSMAKPLIEELLISKQKLHNDGSCIP